MGVVKKMPEINGLTKAEVGSIITLIAEYEGKLELVKEEMEKLFEKKFPMKLLIQIEAAYGEKISKLRAQYGVEIFRNPFASRAIRLRVLWNCYQEEKRRDLVRGSIKIGKEDYLERKEPDQIRIKDIVMAAEKIMDGAERIALEKVKVMGGTVEQYMINQQSCDELLDSGLGDEDDKRKTAT